MIPFIFFVPTGLSMSQVLQPILDAGYVNDYAQYLYWFPTFPFTTVMIDLLNDTPLKYFTASVEASWVFLVLNIPFWFLLHLYVEAIKPDSYGVALHPCFCCKKRLTQQDSHPVANFDVDGLPSERDPCREDPI